MNEILKDQRLKGSFWSYDIIIDIEDIISNNAKLVYFVLCRYANKSSVAFPGIETIAKKASIGEATVKRAIKELENYNIISVLRTKGKGNKYILNKIDDFKLHKDHNDTAHSELAHGDTTPSSQGAYSKLTVSYEGSIPKEVVLKEENIYVSSKEETLEEIKNFMKNLNTKKENYELSNHHLSLLKDEKIFKTLHLTIRSKDRDKRSKLKIQYKALEHFNRLITNDEMILLNELRAKVFKNKKMYELIDIINSFKIAKEDHHLKIDTEYEKYIHKAKQERFNGLNIIGVIDNNKVKSNFQNNQKTQRTRNDSDDYSN